MRNIWTILLILTFSPKLFSQAADLDQRVQEWINDDGPFETRLSEINKLLDESVKTGSVELQANLYRLKGALLYRQGYLEQGLNAILESLKLSRNDARSETYIAALGSVSNIYYRMGEIEKAKSFCKEAIYLTLASGEKTEMRHSSIATSSHNLSQIYYEQDSLDLSSEYIDMFASHLRLSKDTVDICDYYVMKGAIRHKQKKYKEAERYLRQAFTCTQTSQALVQHYSSVSNLGQLFLELNNLDSAIRFFTEGLEIAYKIEDPVIIKEVASDLSVAYERSGDSVKAFQFLKVSRLFADSLLDETKIQALIDAEQKYENEVKSELLAKQQETIKNRQKQLLFMFMLAAVLIALIFLVIINRNKSKQIAKQELKIKDAHITELLQEQEMRNVDAMLKGQDSERQRIARELHDRMGSMLSAIKLHFSVVEDELKKVPDANMKPQEQAMSMLDEAVDEVRKISHDLYSASLVKFGMKAALLQLIKSIEASNRIHISFLDNGVAHEEYQSFEVELYRITQELIGNTLKYANADEVVIQLNKTDTYLVYSYEDNGKGFNTEALKESSGIGYLSIQNRVKKINGISNLDSHPGHGMTFIVEIPL